MSLLSDLQEDTRALLHDYRNKIEELEQEEYTEFNRLVEERFLLLNTPKKVMYKGDECTYLGFKSIDEVFQLQKGDSIVELPYVELFNLEEL